MYSAVNREPSASTRELGFTEFKSSPSVKAMLIRFPAQVPVGSWELVQWFLRNHVYYGRSLAGQVKDDRGPKRSLSRTMEHWVRDLEALFEPKRLKEIRGRHVVLGLAHLDHDLAEHLLKLGVDQAIRDETGALGGDFESLLR